MVYEISSGQRKLNTIWQDCVKCKKITWLLSEKHGTTDRERQNKMNKTKAKKNITLEISLVQSKDQIKK